MLSVPEPVFDQIQKLMAQAESGQISHEEAFRRVLELYPDDHISMLALGDIKLKNGDRAQAETLFWRAVELQPCASQPYLELSVLYQDQQALAFGLAHLGLRKTLLNGDAEAELEDPGSLASFIVEKAELPDDLSPEEKIEELADEFGAATEDEPADVMERLRPLRLIHELQESSDLSRDQVDEILALGKSIVPMLIGVLRGWVQGITHAGDTWVAGNAAALLGEIGDAQPITPLIELSAFEAAFAAGPAEWAMRRIVERHPAEVARVIQDVAPGLSAPEKVAALMLVMKHPEIPVSSELLESVFRNLEVFDPKDRDTTLELLLTSSIMILGIDFGRSMLERYSDLMSRKARRDCDLIIEQLSAEPIPERPPAEPSPWSIYEVCAGEVDWQKEADEAERADLDDEYVPEPIRRMAKPGRNDPCWCGSGKKYKKCHLDADEAAERKRGRE